MKYCRICEVPVIGRTRQHERNVHGGAYTVETRGTSPFQDVALIYVNTEEES